LPSESQKKNAAEELFTLASFHVLTAVQQRILFFRDDAMSLGECLPTSRDNVPVTRRNITEE
jgi:hypothetical protein